MYFAFVLSFTSVELYFNSNIVLNKMHKFNYTIYNGTSKVMIRINN